MDWKLLSPLSILIGLIGALAVLAYLKWPPAEIFVPVALVAFVAIAGVCELARRLMVRKPPATGGDPK
jgi:hypothetical protein